MNETPMTDAERAEKAKQEKLESKKRIAEAIATLLEFATSETKSARSKAECPPAIRADLACPCGNAGCDAVTDLRQPCHPGRGLDVAYMSRQGELKMRCNACHAEIDQRVLVAKERDPLPVAAPAPAPATEQVTPPPAEALPEAYETNPA